jgi:hypothetical protein
MPIAMHIALIRQELDELRLSYRRGEVRLQRLQQLDRQIDALLPQTQGRTHITTLQCMQGLIRSLETRMLQMQGQNCFSSDDVDNPCTSAVA